jgi:hypothetical protein
MLEIERMTLESLFDGKPGQKTPTRLLSIRNRWPFYTVVHGLTVSQEGRGIPGPPGEGR